MTAAGRAALEAKIPALVAEHGTNTRNIALAAGVSRGAVERAVKRLGSDPARTRLGPGSDPARANGGQEGAVTSLSRPSLKILEEKDVTAFDGDVTDVSLVAREDLGSSPARTRLEPIRANPSQQPWLRLILEFGEPTSEALALVERIFAATRQEPPCPRPTPAPASADTLEASTTVSAPASTVTPATSSAPATEPSPKQRRGRLWSPADSPEHELVLGASGALLEVLTGGVVSPDELLSFPLDRVRAVTQHFARYHVKHGNVHSVGVNPRGLFFSLLGREGPLFPPKKSGEVGDVGVECSVGDFCEQLVKKGFDLPHWTKDAYGEIYDGHRARLKPTAPVSKLPPEELERRRDERVLGDLLTRYERAGEAERVKIKAESDPISARVKARADARLKAFVATRNGGSK